MAKQNPKKLTKQFVGKPLPQVETAMSADASAVQQDPRKKKQIGNYKKVDSQFADAFRDIIPAPDNVSQMLAKTIFGDARMSNASLDDEQKVMLWDVMQNAKKRTGKPDGGTEYEDYGGLGNGTSEQFNNWFNRGQYNVFEGAYNSLTNPGFKLGSTIGRGKYFTDPENPDKMYYTDVYDWNAHEKNFPGSNIYQKVRNTLRAGEDPSLTPEKNDNYRMNFELDAKEIEKLRKKENGGWLDKYQEGGPVQPNYNDASVSMSDDFVGDGYSNVGRNYSPAWGGQFEDGGLLPIAQGGTTLANVNVKSKKKEPIVVTNPNDPRLKAYTDSLSLYNWGKDYNRKTYSTAGYAVTDKDLRFQPIKDIFPAGTSKKDILKYEKQDLKDHIQSDAKMKEGIQGGWETADQMKTQKIFNKLAKKSLSTGIMPTGHYSGEGYFPAFKKPTQPVVYQERTYQKETPELQPLPIQGMNANLPELQRVEGPSKWMRSFGAGANQNYWSKVDAYGMPLPGYVAPNQHAVVQPQGPGPEFADGGEIAQTGKQVPFDQWYKTVPKSKNDTINYNLRRAYELAPQKDLDAFVKNPKAHLMSAYENPETGIYEFMKSKHHSTIDKELNWYNGKGGKDFKNNYDLDTTGDYYRYVPKEMAMGGSMPGAVGFMYARYEDGGLVPGDVGFSYPRTINPAPSKGPYGKKTVASAQNGMEMLYYQNGLDFKPKSISKNGSKVIKDDMGQWNHPGKVTEIGSNQITMQGVPYPVMGISDTGDMKMMYPNQDYNYHGSSVTEYPMMVQGGQLTKLDQLTNFTNYNTKQPGENWLDKYQ
jgi:hypothetical protein